jgi:hypothetical protein
VLIITHKPQFSRLEAPKENDSEQNLKTSGIKVQSGLCSVKGQNLFIMDKHKSVHKKIGILAAQLATIPHEDLYIIPAVRELLEKYSV